MHLEIEARELILAKIISHSSLKLGNSSHYSCMYYEVHFPYLLAYSPKMGMNIPHPMAYMSEATQHSNAGQMLLLRLWTATFFFYVMWFISTNSIFFNDNSSPKDVNYDKVPHKVLEYFKNTLVSL